MDVVSEGSFRPGIEVARSFWEEAVRPILEKKMPDAKWAAALIGPGSEVHGFDTVRSTDHSWGPRVLVFIHEDTLEQRSGELDRLLERDLPQTFGGHPVRFPAKDDAAASHQVVLTSVGRWFEESLGFDPRQGITIRHWLSTPSQSLRAATGGAVFEDSDGELTEARNKLKWYPDEVWIYLLGCQWRRLDQEEPFVGRTGEVGDEIGSSLIAARLVRDLMRLCFLIERQYAPYMKWFGSAFSLLKCGPELEPLLSAVLAARNWHDREDHLIRAFEMVAEMFNALEITEPQEPTARLFHTRPFRVIGSGRFVDACMKATPLRSLGYAGSLDQLADSTDVLSNPAFFTSLGSKLWD